MDKIVLLDFGMGNLQSLRNALAYLGAKYEIVDKFSHRLDVEKIIIPGVGHFDDAMSNIKNRRLNEFFMHMTDKPSLKVLGICLGMQLMFESSEESHTGVHVNGLGLIPGKVKKLELGGDQGLRVPHIGWNNITKIQEDKIIEDVDKLAGYYFVHSYYVSCDSRYIIAETDYGHKFPSIIKNKNLYGMQFHPEKSHTQGLGLLKRFLELP